MKNTGFLKNTKTYLHVRYRTTNILNTACRINTTPTPVTRMTFSPKDTESVIRNHILKLNMYQWNRNLHYYKPLHKLSK